MPDYIEKHPHRFVRDGDGWCRWHHLQDGSRCGFGEFVHRWPCSPTCTHDDAWTPGHPERVRERSEAVKAIGPLGEDTTEAAAAYDQGLTTGYDNGVEAMRAACWEAVREYLDESGLSTGAPAMCDHLKKKIEGATP